MGNRVTIGQGTAVQSAGPQNIPVVQLQHSGTVGFAVTAGLAAASSVTYSVSAVDDRGNYDQSQVLTLTATTAAPFVTISPVQTGMDRFCAWISATTGTVNESTCTVVGSV